MKRSLFLAALLLSCTSLFAADVHSWMTPDEATIGDRLEYQLKITGLNNRELRYPVTDGGGFELLDIDSSTFAQDGTLRFGYAVYDTGRYTFPSLDVVIGAGAAAETLRTEEHSVFIRTVLSDTSAAIRENKALRSVEFSLADELIERWPWIAMVLLIAALVWFALWRHKRRKQRGEAYQPPEIILPPHELAVQELIALRDKKYPQRGLLKEFYSEFSEVLRRYLERRYGLPVLEMTTYELEYKFDAPDYPEIINHRLLPALRESDLVKFAKFIPDPATCATALDLGFTVVDATRERAVVSEKETAAA